MRHWLKHQRNAAAVWFAALLLAQTPAYAQEPVEPFSLQSALRPILTDSGAPAAGAVVASSDGVLEVAVLGVRQLGGTAAAADDDRFHIGSVTKPFTATIVARLVESGLLAWDSRVADVLPDAMATARREFAEITLAHLLAHEAGVKPMEEDAELDEVPELIGDIHERRKQFAKWVLQQEPAVEPTKEYRYSNAHFVIAAAMAETVSGKTWERLIEEHIFERFSMNSGGFGWPKGAPGEVLWGHRARNGDLTPVDPDGAYRLPRYFAPAGDIHASLPDMAVFFSGLLRAWQGTEDYLDRDTLERMMTRRLRGGLGWGVTSAFGFDRVVTYSGSADTFLMVVVMIPDADRAFVVAANAFSGDVEGSVVQALRSIVSAHVPVRQADTESR